MTIRKILLPLDGSLLSDAALALVRRLLRADDVEVTLLTVVPERDAQEERRAREHIHGLGEALSRDVQRVNARVVCGDPTTRILEAARALQPSLIALATHGRDGLDRLFQGSTAQKVLRRAPCPVLLMNPHAVAAPGEGRFRRILVPLDGSELAAEILPLVSETARVHDSEVVLFHAVDFAVYLDPIPGLSAAESPADVERFLEKFRPRLDGVRMRVISTMGGAAISIVDAARSENADLIALTTHGRSGPTRWLFGSIAEQVVLSVATSLDPLLARSMAPWVPRDFVELLYSFASCPPRFFGFCLGRYDSPSITRS